MNATEHDNLSLPRGEKNTPPPPEPSELSARLLWGVGGLYGLVLSTGECGLARGRGLLRKQGIRPMPGDRVWVTPSGDCDAPWTLRSVQKRQNVWIRPPLANLDVLVLVIACTNPEPSPYLIDKLLILARSQGVTPCLCWTKSDQVDSKVLATWQEIYAPSGFPSFVVTRGPDGVRGREALQLWLENKTAAFTGASGVGKSTLLNQLFGEKRMATGELSERLGRGKHTTRHVEFFPSVKGGLWADTPGFTALELSELGVPEAAVLAGYPEFAELESGCRFSSCRHLQEPGCAVRSTWGQHERWQRYCELRQALSAFWKQNPGRHPDWDTYSQGGNIC